MKEDKYNEVSIPMEVEADGFITRVDDLEYTQSVFSTARLSKGCIYPNCEKCGYYREHYCTVPMVISKQIYRLTDEKLRSLEKRLTELENIVTDVILGSRTRDGITLHPATKEQEEALNYTLMEYIDDFLGEDE